MCTIISKQFIFASLSPIQDPIKVWKNKDTGNGYLGHILVVVLHTKPGRFLLMRNRESFSCLHGVTFILKS